MPGLEPRLSGLAWAEREAELGGTSDWAWSWLFETVDRPAVHEIGAHETGEGEQTLNGVLGIMSEAQEQESDERDGKLNAHGVLAFAEEMSDLQRLFDPAEEQFDLPAPLVE